jgi:hypothetical protein
VKELLKDIARAVAVPIATELAGALRAAREKEHDAAIRAREQLAALRGESEPGK